MKTNFARFGFKKEELESLAAIASKNLTDESTDEDINNALTGVEEFAALMQSVSNRAVSDIKKKMMPPTPPTPAPQPNPDEDYKAELAELKAQIAALNNKQKAAALMERVMGNDKLKNVPKSFIQLGKYSVNDESEIDAVVAQVEQDFAAVKGDLLKNGTFVEQPIKVNGKNETASDDEVKAMAAML